ncbi:retrovirus-related pol polyprotein from transposon TNT 1-94 [Tanacetum coccineum]|uniref:Retrovirus-related pol polyprotein from transposon TNT 1-94 n=1 Tax=Tanacetum coccineum TaxID=301880 RepID=A0ABQ4WEI3_9ASTR
MSQDSKTKVHNTGSSKSLKPKPIQKPQLKCELYHYTNHSTDDYYRILYCMICKKEDHRTSDHEMYIASLKRNENYKAQPYQYTSSSKQILKAKAKPFPACTHYGFNDHRPDDYRNYPKCEICGSYDHFTSGYNRVIQIRGGRHIREPIWYLNSGCSRSITGVKSYLHKYVEQPSLKVVFGDNSSCITEGYGLINCGGVVFKKVAFVNGLKYNLISISQLCDAKYIVQFDDKQGTIFNANKEIVLIAPRRNDVYVLDMSSLTPNEAYFFAKASKSDKPCTTCEKGKHHRASFKTKQNFSIRKCLYLLHMDLFGPVSLMSINHEKYTLVIVDDYLRMVENQNDVKVKQIRTDNGTEFRNHKLKSFCDEKGISQNFSSPYTPEQNGVAERKNRNLIEATRTMLNDLVLSKHFWTKAVRIACYTQNRSIIVKRHDKTPYEIFRERIPDISYFHDIPLSQKLLESLTQEDDKYPPDEFLQEDDSSRQYQVDSDVSYYIIPHGRSLTKLTQENHVPKVIAPNEPNIPHTEDAEGTPDLINTEETHEQNVQNDQMITQPTDIPSGNNTEVSGSITESLVPDVTQSHISNQASTSSRPVPQDRYQEEGINYDETFAPVARIEAIRIFLAFSTYMNFKVYQMEVKSAFLNGKLKEEVYVKQPLGFESSEFPDYICKFDKSLYGLKQAPKFEKPMTKKFEMSMMGELTYFLGLQIKQDDKGILIFQQQYTRNLLKKYEISNSSSVKTPMVPPNNLGSDLASKPVNETSYRGMIRSLMYLTATRPDIQFSIVLCFDLKGYSDLDYAGCNMDRKSTLGACQILGEKLVCWSAKKQQSVAMSSNEDEYVAAGDYILKGDIELHFIPTEYQLADIFTKPLDEPTFTRLKVLDENYSSTEQVNSIQQLLAYCLITGTEVDIGEIIYSDLVTKLLNKFRLKYVSYPRFISCALQVLLGFDYTQDENFEFLPGILSNYNFTKDPSKVTDIELTAHMIAINSQKDSVSPLPLAAKPKKGKSQTMTQILPKSQGPEVPGALSKKNKRPKSKKPPTETKVTPPKPTKGSEQSHSVSSSTVPDP